MNEKPANLKTPKKPSYIRGSVFKLIKAEDEFKNLLKSIYEDELRLITFKFIKSTQQQPNNNINKLYKVFKAKIARTAHSLSLHTKS